MPNTCLLGLNHLVKLNDIFNFMYMTHDLMFENNNAIVGLTEKCLSPVPQKTTSLIAEGPWEPSPAAGP